MEGKVAVNYLHDLVHLLKAKAIEAKREKNASDNSDYDVALGKLIAYQDVISLLQEQAKSFGIPLEQLGLNDFDPYEELR